jgi:anthranilate phosphoribosyltransferase
MAVDLATDLTDGVAKAAQAVDSGKALNVLRELARVSHGQG